MNQEEMAKIEEEARALYGQYFRKISYLKDLLFMSEKHPEQIHTTLLLKTAVYLAECELKTNQSSHQYLWTNKQ
jgi:hypothetical protein